MFFASAARAFNSPNDLADSTAFEQAPGEALWEREGSAIGFAGGGLSSESAAGLA
jgi:hypothetical protein